MPERGLPNPLIKKTEITLANRITMWVLTDINNYWAQSASDKQRFWQKDSYKTFNCRGASRFLHASFIAYEEIFGIWRKIKWSDF